MSKWSGETKGFALGYQIFIFFIKYLGVPLSYLLLYFVVPVYYLFLRKARLSLYETFKILPQLKSRNIHALVYNNFHNLGKVLIDNFAILTQHKRKYKFSGEGAVYLKDLIRNSKPAILISAHFGGWRSAGEFLQKRGGTVNIVMYDGESKKIKELVENKIGENKFKLILIKHDLSHLFKIKTALENNEFICIHGDRYIEGAKTISAKMFNKNIELPFGPFAIASKLNVPYSFVFVVKKAMYEYKFTATKPEISNNPQIIANKYTEILSEKLITHPEQWFNYFNIFEKNK